MSSSGTSEGEAIQVRDVALVPGERITHVFCPEAGLTEELPGTGEVLIATNQRVLAFCRNDGRNETFLVPVEELNSVVIKTRTRGSASVLQGIVVGVGAILLYLAVAYWLTGRFDGPAIPLIRMDIAPFLLLLVALLGVLLAGRYYFAKDDGAVTFQGANWSFAFHYRGGRASQQIYQVVNSVFATRLSKNGYSYLWED